MLKKYKLKIIPALGSLMLAAIFGILFAMENQADVPVDPQITENENLENTSEESPSAFDSYAFDESEDADSDSESSNDFTETPDTVENDFAINNENKSTEEPFMNNSSVPQQTMPTPPIPAKPSNPMNTEQPISPLAPTADQLSIQVKQPLNDKKNKEVPMPKTINIGITENNRMQMTNALQKLLADEYLLYTKTLNFHWNVEGKHFGPLHALFNEQYEKLLSIVDSIAERIRAIGSFTHATMKEFLSMSSLTEKTGDFPDDITMLSQLLADHEAIIQTIRNANDLAVKINDGGSNNFLSGLLETHEKIAWMLRAHLNK